MSETYRDLEHALKPITASSSKTEGLIRLITGGRVDFWTLNNPRAGRSRKYHGVVLDEVAFAGADMEDIWDQAIEPTLLDFGGVVWALSTPAGKNNENWFYKICSDKSLGWREFYAPTSSNPMMDPNELASLEKKKPPLVWRQEYMAEFVDWAGAAFFDIEKLLVDGQPLGELPKPDDIFLTIDTAMKDGAQHDGTACILWARFKHHLPGAPELVILDYDILQIDAALLVDWLPNRIADGQRFAKTVGARLGFAGAWIEDASSGTVLIQEGRRRGMPVQAIDTALTAIGKEGRALAVSEPVYQGKVKINRYAYDKIVNYRSTDKNHLVDQLGTFRIGMPRKEHNLDLIDCFTYGVSIALGDSEGW